MHRLRWTIFLIPIYVVLYNLDHVSFWDDEAQTAILAENFLKRGQLTGWDGAHLYGYRNGSLLRSDFSVIQPPADILMTAISFKFLGISDATARLPFAIAGLIAILVFASVLKEFDLTEKARFLALIAFSFSTPFLLNARQCRYYSLSLLAGLLFFRLWQWTLKTPSWTASIAMALSVTMFYFTNYMLALAFVIITALMSFFTDRQRFSRAFRYLIASAWVALALATAHAFSFRIWDRSDVFYDDNWIFRHAIHLWKYPRDLLFYLPTPLIILLIYFARPIRAHKTTWSLLGLFYGNALTIALLTPQPSQAIYCDFRFLILSLPWGAALLGELTHFLNQRSKYWGWAVLLITLNSTALIAPYTRQPLQWTLPYFFFSIHKKYPTGVEETAGFLRSNLRSGETLYTAPEHFSYPLKYYIPNATLCCVLDDKTTLTSARALPAPLFRETNSPQWIVLFENAPHTRTTLEYFSIRADYELVKTLDVYFDQTQRPEPFEHLYFPRRQFSPTEQVFIYRKIRSKPKPG